MNVKRLASINVWRGLALVLVCFIALAALASDPSAVEAGNGRLYMQPPPPPPPTDTPSAPPPPPTNTPGAPPPPITVTPNVPPPPGPSAPGAGPVIKYKGTSLVPEGPAPTKFTINGCAQVVRPPDLNLNEKPGFGEAYVQGVGVGQQVRVLAGPVGADGLWWWKFRSPEGREGWGVGDYAEPSIAPCVAASGAPKSLGGLPLTGAGSGWLIPGVILAALLIVVAVLRRRRAQVTVDRK